MSPGTRRWSEKGEGSLLPVGGEAYWIGKTKREERKGEERNSCQRAGEVFDGGGGRPERLVQIWSAKGGKKY